MFGPCRRFGLPEGVDLQPCLCQGGKRCGKRASITRHRHISPVTLVPFDIVVSGLGRRVAANILRFVCDRVVTRERVIGGDQQLPIRFEDASELGANASSVFDVFQCQQTAHGSERLTLKRHPLGAVGDTKVHPVTESIAGSLDARFAGVAPTTSAPWATRYSAK